MTTKQTLDSARHCLAALSPVAAGFYKRRLPGPCSRKGGGPQVPFQHPMAAFLDFKDLAHRISTAGLEPDQTSVKGLGRDYEFAELLLTGLELGLELDELVRHIQVTDYGSQQIEKYFQLYQSPNHASTEALVADVLKRHQIALRKAAIVNPEIAPISLHYE